MKKEKIENFRKNMKLQSNKDIENIICGDCRAVFKTLEELSLHSQISHKTTNPSEDDEDIQYIAHCRTCTCK